MSAQKINWIPVSDGEPEPLVDVLVSCRIFGDDTDRSVLMAYRSKDGRWIMTGLFPGDCPLHEVTHWAELPDLPPFALGVAA